MRKRQVLISTIALLGLGFAAIAYLPRLTRPASVRQLLETKQCRGCDLSRADLKYLDLQGVDLEGANLAGANLEGTRLGNANLKRTNLTGANLSYADLGCTQVSLKLRADEKKANIGFDLDTTPKTGPGKGTQVDFTLNADEKGATLNFNLKGCADLQEARLAGAIMPDGSIHPATLD